MVNYSDKHYELLATTIKRYLKGTGDNITLVELGKAINMIVEMVERESMRDDREARNK
jgi:phosphoribosylformylglycinamidine (FGAM) synthase PurS component